MVRTDSLRVLCMPQTCRGKMVKRITTVVAAIVTHLRSKQERVSPDLQYHSKSF